MFTYQNKERYLYLPGGETSLVQLAEGVPTGDDGKDPAGRLLGSANALGCCCTIELQTAFGTRLGDGAEKSGTKVWKQTRIIINTYLPLI